MTAMGGGSLLYLLCDVAGDAERADVAEMSVQGAAREDLEGKKALYGARKKNGKEKKRTGENRSPIGKPRSPSNVNTGPVLSKNKKKQGICHGDEQAKPEPYSQAPPPEWDSARRCLDLENALKESNEKIFSLQQDKLALQQRCAHVESILTSIGINPHHVAPGPVYPPSHHMYSQYMYSPTSKSAGEAISRTSSADYRSSLHHVDFSPGGRLAEN